MSRLQDENAALAEKNLHLQAQINVARRALKEKELEMKDVHVRCLDIFAVHECA